MHVGAIVTVPSSSQWRKSGETEEAAAASVRWSPPCSRTEILGQNLVDRVFARLTASGVNEVVVIDETTDPQAEFSAPQNNFWFQWDATIGRFLKNKAKTLLLIRLGPYVEIDLVDFLRVHRETSSPMTQAFDRQGALDLVAIDGDALSAGTGTHRSRLRSLLSHQQKYGVSGYSNRLRTFQDFRRLVADGLSGNAALRPNGREVSPNVWVGDAAVIHEAARIVGPAFIGSNTRVGAGCVVTGGSAIERNCEIDCNATVHQSCVLPGTYLGLGVKVRNSVVAGKSLFHLGRNVQLHIEDSHILGNEPKPRRFVSAARNIVRKTNLRREQSCQPTSSDLHL